MTQAEGGEQGDPLMPLLFSIGIQGALEEVADAMRPDEQICAFLDDVYIVCQPERVRVLFDLLAESLFRVAGIRLHARMWNASGTVPDNVEELGPAVWQPRGMERNPAIAEIVENAMVHNVYEPIEGTRRVAARLAVLGFRLRSYL